MAVPGSRGEADLPGEPISLSSSVKAPAGDEWLHEIFWPGYRLQAQVTDGKVQLQTPDGQDWSERLPRIASTLRVLGLQRLRMDGVLVALDARGHGDPHALDAALEGHATDALRYIAFDLAAIAGVSLEGSPLVARKSLLRAMLADSPSPALVFGEHVLGHGARVLADSRRKGLPGIVSKRAGATGLEPLLPWLKVGVPASHLAVVIGYRRPRSPSGRAALWVATRAGGQLQAAGVVHLPAPIFLRTGLAARLALLGQAEPATAIADDPPVPVRWVRPDVVVELAPSARRKSLQLVRRRRDKSLSDVGA